MSEGLNYLRIAQILGGRLTSIDEPEFGALGAQRAAAERYRLLDWPADEEKLSLEHTKKIAAAFEATRHGYEPDRVMVDPALSKEFIAKCRQLGVDASIKTIFKKLQQLRKAPPLGLEKLRPCTRAAGLDPAPYYYVAELAFTQLSYRLDASVDDVITEPDVSEEFVSICRQIKPNVHAREVKWSLLRLRKMRTFTAKKRRQLLSIPVEQIERSLEPIGTLERFSMRDVPEQGGIYTFRELNSDGNYLYVGTGKNLKTAVAPFEDAQPFRAVAGRFWDPSLREISLSVALIAKNRKGTPKHPTAREQSLRLVEQRRPLFNLPVHIEAA